MTDKLESTQVRSLALAVTGLTFTLITFYLTVASGLHYWPFVNIANKPQPTITASTPTSAATPVSTTTFSLPNGTAEINLSTIPPTITKNRSKSTVSVLLESNNHQVVITAGSTLDVAAVGPERPAFEECHILLNTFPQIVGVIATKGNNICIGKQNGEVLALLTIDSISAHQVSMHIVQWRPLPEGPTPSGSAQAPSPTVGS